MSGGASDDLKLKEPDVDKQDDDEDKKLDSLKMRDSVRKAITNNGGAVNDLLNALGGKK